MDFGYKKLYIGGNLQDAVNADKKEVICPATESSVAQIAWAGNEDAVLALEAAKKGFGYWSELSLVERTNWMLRLRDAVIEKEEILREAVMYEMGKTWEQSEEDYETVINSLEFYPKAMSMMNEEILTDVEGTHQHSMIHQPAGVVVAYLAWNFPLLNVGFKLGPVLASGCSLIIKPSSTSPLSAYVLGEILADIDFPAGVVNILAGGNDTVAETLTTSKIPAVLTMIGSTQTAKKLIAKSTTSIKRMSMELGGNAPFIVFPDADLENAAGDLKALKYGNCGQVCVSPNRIFIHERVYKEFMNIFMEKVRKINVGFGRGSGVEMGPLVSAGALNNVEYVVADAVKKGAKITHGGKREEGKDTGFFFEPTVIENITSEMEIFRNEVFGPIAGIMPFSDDDEVLELANDTEYGLSSYVYTAGAERIQKFTDKLEFGEVHVNGFKYAIYLPHGGIKQSGMGYDCSYLALHDYLIKKRITITKY